MAENNIGKITQIISAVIDIKFTEGNLPEINSAINIKTNDGSKLVVEVAQHLGDDTVRCIALGPTDGLVRGMEAEATGAPISVPVGEQTLGRMFNVLGDPIDNKPAPEVEHMPIHRKAPAFVEQATNTEMLETGIKVVDLLCPYQKGGKIGLFGGAGVGKTVLIQELIRNIATDNPHFIKAHLLLALIYIKDSEYTRAKKLLNGVLKIDKNNTLALKYLEQISQAQAVKDNDTGGSFLPKKKVKEEDSKPLNGNDVILPRSSYKEPSNGAITIINVLVGIVIGAALIWFLVMPSRYKGMTEEYNRSLADYSEKLSSGNVELNSLESELKSVKADKEALEEQLGKVNGTEGGNKLLISVIEAANEYIANNRTAAAEKIVDIDVSELPSDSAKSLYNTISGATFASAASEFYSKAQSEYSKSDYETAAEDYAKAFRCDSTNVNAAYYAAKCYVALSQTDNAKKYYEYIVNDFKTSGYYREADEYVPSH